MVVKSLNMDSIISKFISLLYEEIEKVTGYSYKNSNDRIKVKTLFKNFTE